MADKTGKRARQGAKKRRRACVNHPKTPAVTRCEVCGKPICRSCANLYEGPRICSEECWRLSAVEERKRADAEQRALRKKRDRMADRAVTTGMWAVVLIVIGAAAIFLYSRASDRTGEKLWEFSGSGYSRNYSVLPYSNTIGFASSDGSVKAIDCQTGKPIWSVRLPEGEKASNIRMIDDERCLVHSENKVFLCGSTKGTPLWQLTAPQPAIYAEPVISKENLYLASSSHASYYEMSPLMRVLSALPREQWRPTETQAEEEEKTVSTITAAAMTSGAVRWQTELEDIRIGGLLADEARVYAAGYRPMRYSSMGFSKRGTSARGESDESEEEMLGTTQLWALNAKTGDREWKLEGTGSFLVSPMMSEEGIVFATKENIYLVSPDGHEQWKFPIINRTVYSLKPHEDKLLVSTSDGNLKCLDLRSGKEKWTVNIGVPVEEMAVSYQMVCVPGLVEVGKEPRKVIPTKRWEGSEDLLEQAFKSSGEKYEPILLALDIDNGETLWSIRKIEGELKYADGVVYALRHTTRVLLLDASVDPSDLAKTVSNLSAFDAATGKKLWETGIDGRASGLRLAAGAALMVAYPEQMSIAAGTGGAVPVRMIAISLQ